MNLSIPLPFWVAAEQKMARVEVNISLAFLHWVRGELSTTDLSSLI